MQELADKVIILSEGQPFVQQMNLLNTDKDEIFLEGQIIENFKPGRQLEVLRVDANDMEAASPKVPMFTCGMHNGLLVICKC
jgi:hypothetical protein